MNIDTVFLQEFVFKYLHPATPIGVIVITVVTIWSLFWKVLGLWKAARNDDRLWFIAIFILNTLGIFEIAYLSFFAKEKLTIDKIKSNVRSYKINNPLKRETK